MNKEIIWEKIQEFAIAFYNFAMTQGENDFLLTKIDWIHRNDLPQATLFFLLGSFAIMVLFVIFASDSFLWFTPLEEIMEWGEKISILKVVVFAAAVFSFHTFYKMLITATGGAIHADASVAALDCLGSFINPISVMIYAIAVSTMFFERGNIQALFLGWVVFFIPVAMSYNTFTKEHIMLYLVSASFGFVGMYCYARNRQPYNSYFIMSILYFIVKFFMIYYSEEVMLLTAEDWPGKIGQYLACMQMDVILSLVLLLILFGYKAIILQIENLHIKKDVTYSAIISIFMIITVVAGNVIDVKAVPLKKADPAFSQSEEEEDSDEEEEVEEEPVDLPRFVIYESSANIRSGPGTDYEVLTTVSEGAEFWGTGNEATAENGRIWYEIYMDEDQEQVGWASEAVIQMQ